MSGVRYNVATVREAKKLRQAGWSLRSMQSILEKEFGVRPTRDTLKVWTDPAFAEQRRERYREKRTQMRAEDWNFLLAGSNHTQAYKQAFIERLRSEGVPAASIAKVCCVVFGEPWSRSQINTVLGKS